MPTVYTVSTCREPLEVMPRFVYRNLGAGADHLFVFLDAPDREVEDFLGEHPNVTTIVTDRRYWGAVRPSTVNTRQKVNANLIRVALAGAGRPGWLFHIDADETLHLDRSELAALPPEVRGIRLRPLEAVSTDRPGWSEHYKRLLTEQELSLLCMLGVIAETRNAALFHAHYLGKIGIRPALDLTLEIHHARSADGAKMALRTGPGLHVLHHASSTPDEFIDQWTKHARHSQKSNFGPNRTRIRDSFRVLLDADLSEADRRELMLELYQRSTADDVDRLHKLGLLVTVEDRREQRRPAAHDPEQAARLDRVIAALIEEGPNNFRPTVDLGHQVAATRRAGRRIADTDPKLADRISQLCAARRAGHRSSSAGLRHGARRWLHRAAGHSRQKTDSTTRRARRATR